MRLFLSFALLCITFINFGQNLGYKQGELLVQLYTDSSPETFITKFEIETDIDIAEFSVIADVMNIYHIKFEDEAIDLDRCIKILEGYPEINLVQKNHLITQRETIPDDLLFDELWQFKNTGADGGTPDADIDATDAWDITTGGLTTHGDTIVVCVIEGGGVDISHADLQNNIWKNYAEIPGNGIDDDANGYIDDFNGWNVLSEDDLVGSGGHGTRVCGMIGAEGDNGFGITGVNWDVKMMIIKGQQATVESSVIEAYTYPLKMRKRYNETFGEEGAFVVATNASWGIDEGDPDDSPLWCAIYDSLGQQGILNIAATTNEDDNVEVVGDMPTNCTSNYLIGVTMTNNQDIRAGSGFGTTSIDLAAPGFGLTVANPGDTFTTANGTSFAAPCVTGAVALAYSAPCAEFINLVKYDPPAAALQMRDYILNGVDEIPGLLTDVATGGRLNIKNSIDLIMDDCDETACIPPYHMRVTDISDTSVNVIWEGFSDDYILVIQQAGEEAVEIPITGTSFNFDTLTPCTGYTITIKAICDPDTSDESFPITFTTDGCCINPALTNPVKTEDALTISWAPVLYATEYNFRYTKIDEDDWTELEGVTAPLLIEGLDECTEYEFQIHTVCGDSTRGFSESSIFRTLGCGACTELDYCPVLGANAAFEWIDSVYINGVAKGTGSNSGWLQSEQIITALTPGETYTVRLVPGYSGSTFTEQFSIYVDFDQNGSFELPTDRILADFTTSGPGSTTVNIPAGAAIGVTRIRIAMAPLAATIACPVDPFYGEYEDYCVYIGPQLGLDELELTPILLYPNPVKNELYIQTDEEIQQINIYTNDGKLVNSISGYNGSPINTENFTEGVYIIQISTSERVTTQKFIKH